MSEGGKTCSECAWCGSVANFSCRGCGEAHYCSRDHQKQDWCRHAAECRAYRVTSSREAGDYLYASRKIKAGALLFTDDPLVIGPLSSSPLVCLGCDSLIEAEDFFRCPDCQWPVCDINCAFHPNHVGECDILARDAKQLGVPKHKADTPRYDLIILVRCLLLKHSNPEKWKTLMQMASHWRRHKELEEPHHVAAITFLKDVYHVDECVDTLHQIRGAAVTNAIEVRNRTGVKLRALYGTVRLLNHSCVPNVHLSVDGTGRMHVRSSVDIEQGDPLTICYTGTTEPLWSRQTYATHVYFFKCTCDRCLDPTELGTYFSNPRCSSCKNQYLLPERLSHSTRWICPECKCDFETSELQEEVDQWLSRFGMDDTFTGQSPEKLARVLSSIQQSFHSKHYVFMTACQMAIKGLHNVHTYSAYKLKRGLWEQLLDIFNVLEAGLTRRRGLTMLEAGKASLQAAQTGDKEMQASNADIMQYLTTARQNLTEAVHILRLEPRDTPEHELLFKAQLLLNEIGKLQQKYEDL